MSTGTGSIILWKGENYFFWQKQILGANVFRFESFGGTEIVLKVVNLSKR